MPADLDMLLVWCTVLTVRCCIVCHDLRERTVPPQDHQGRTTPTVSFPPGPRAAIPHDLPTTGLADSAGAASVQVLNCQPLGPRRHGAGAPHKLRTPARRASS